MNDILKVYNITKIFKNKRGVRDITFNLKKGEIYGLLGSNGAGKTTILKIITGLIKQDKGTVMIFGNDLNENHEDALYNIGSLIENPSFIEYISVEKNMEIASKYYNTKNKIDDILHLVGLLKFKNEKPENFSLGMKQRLGIALSLVGDPKLIILDEPTNGFDIEGMIDIRNIILNLKQKKDVSFLISSHLAIEIEKICTKVGIMYEGSLINECTMDFIHENYPSVEEYFLNIIREHRESNKKSNMGE